MLLELVRTAPRAYAVSAAHAVAAARVAPAVLANLSPAPVTESTRPTGSTVAAVPVQMTSSAVLAVAARRVVPVMEHTLSSASPLALSGKKER